MDVVRVEEVEEHANGLPACIRVVEINELHERRLIGLVHVVDSDAGRYMARVQLDDMLALPAVVAVPEFLGVDELVAFADVEDRRRPERPGAPVRPARGGRSVRGGRS